MKKIIFLAPIYNDWNSFSILLKNIGEFYSDYQTEFSIKIIGIDDGSFENFTPTDLPNNHPVEIITLKQNMGHQRAIATGLQYINSEITDFDFVIVLDGDGEDNPRNAIDLIKKCEELNGSAITFAKRKKRQESIKFKIGYYFYKIIFYFLTNQKIGFGNFSCIPKKLLKKVTTLEELWNHYSGSIIKSKIPYNTVLIDRDKRYSGTSKMNFTSLVLHGLSSISIYFDVISVRILRLSFIGVLFCFFSITIVFCLKMLTDLAIPGWASNLVLLILIIVIQLSSVTLIVLLMQLSARKNITPPTSDFFKQFIDSKYEQ